MDEPEYCCPKGYVNEHYHCANCGDTCGMMGHINKQGEWEYCTPPELRKPWMDRFVLGSKPR